VGGLSSATGTGATATGRGLSWTSPISDPELGVMGVMGPNKSSTVEEGSFSLRAWLLLGLASADERTLLESPLLSRSRLRFLVLLPLRPLELP